MFLHVQYQSQILNGGAEFGVFLPENATYPLKMVFLTHGAFSDYASSLFDSSIIRYCERRNLAIVAPGCYLGLYTDMVHGEPVYSHLKEALRTAEKMFPCLSKRREDRYLLGISMGGHGAYKLAMEFPEEFCAAAACSSPIDVVQTMTLLEAGQIPGGDDLFHAFGSAEAYRNTVGDVMRRAEDHLRAGTELPRLYLCWGDEDHAKFEDSMTVKRFEEMGIPITVRVGKGGHDFYTWDPLLEEILDWMLKGGEPDGVD